MSVARWGPLGEKGKFKSLTAHRQGIKEKRVIGLGTAHAELPGDVSRVVNVLRFAAASRSKAMVRACFCNFYPSAPHGPVNSMKGGGKKSHISAHLTGSYARIGYAVDHGIVGFKFKKQFGYCDAPWSRSRRRRANPGASISDRQCVRFRDQSALIRQGSMNELKAEAG